MDFTPAKVGPQPDHTPDWRAPPDAPSLGPGVVSEAPLNPAEKARLAVLRASPVLHTDAEEAERAALTARENIPLPPLTPDEVKRLADLGGPRVLSPEDTAKLDDLSRRSTIPRPLPAFDASSADTPTAHMHLVLTGMLSLIETIAALVPTAHAITPQINSLKQSLGALWAMAHNPK